MYIILKAIHKPGPKTINLPITEHRAVKSINHASIEAREWIESHGLGGGNWIGGQVVDESGKTIARISYNGRAWDLSGKEIKL